ncbi:MAG: AAA family ATPase [Actinobacteria bacterium]|nr:AAA family ATPase [Actinomycetota bacterium]
MFVVVTGPDGAGKSTLIEELKDKFQFDVVHKGIPPKSIEEAEATLWEVLFDKIRTDKNYLCDRLNYPDDMIYSPIITGQDSELIVDQEAGIVRVLKECKAYFIYVTAPIDVILERDSKRGGDPYVAREKHEAIVNAYEHMFAGFPLPYSKIDTSVYNVVNAGEKAWRDVLYYYTVNSNWKGAY